MVFCLFSNMSKTYNKTQTKQLKNDENDIYDNSVCGHDRLTLWAEKKFWFGLCSFLIYKLHP